MRSTTCMTDYREVVHGRDLLATFFRDGAKHQSFIDAVDAIAPKAAGEAYNDFERSLSDILFQTYIASMSEHDDKENSHGRLSMWRAFGGVSARVALVIRLPFYSGGADKLNLIFSPVGYLNKEQVHDEMKKVINNINAEADFLKTLSKDDIRDYVFAMLLAAVTCLKHEGFREEREWRAIYRPNPKRPAPDMQSQVEPIGGVPQTIFAIPLDKRVSEDLAGLDVANIFDSLIVGPWPNPWAMSEAFAKELTAIGVPDARNRVRISGIPLRT